MCQKQSQTELENKKKTKFDRNDSRPEERKTFDTLTNVYLSLIHRIPSSLT